MNKIQPCDETKQMPDDHAPIQEKTVPPSRVIEEVLAGYNADEPSIDRWAQSQAVLLSWTIDAAKSTRALSRSRLRANTEAWKSLMTCRDSAELAGLQRAYMENAMGDYRNYAQAVSSRMRQCVRDMTPGTDNAGNP